MSPITSRLRKSRRPALLHLGLGATLALASIALVLHIWYPGELRAAQGVSRPGLIMIGVNVVLGPLITLIVFDPHKWGVRFDMAVIATMQLLALGYGLYTIHGGRPAYVVFNVNRFDVVSFQDLDEDSLSRVPQGLEPFRWKPRTVAARLPEDPAKRNDLLFSALDGGPDLPQSPEYYVPLDEERAAMLSKLHPMTELKKLNELDDNSWSRLVESLGRAEEKMGYLPMVAKARDGVVVLDRGSAEIIGTRILAPLFESTKPVADTPSG